MALFKLRKFTKGPLGREGLGLKQALSCLALFLALIAVIGCQGTFPDQESLGRARSDHPEYTLGPGDSIRVTVYEHEDLSGTFTVDDGGRISLPLVRGINVRSLTLPELEETIIQNLMRHQIIDPKVSIDFVGGLRPFCILGEVRNPGCFNYVHGMIASKAIATAGGYTYRALKNKLLITREDGRKVTGDHDTPIFVGDMIEVFERLF